MDVSENSGISKMDGENNGKPYCLIDDLGVPAFKETPIYIYDIRNIYRKAHGVFFKLRRNIPWHAVFKTWPSRWAVKRNPPEKLPPLKFNRDPHKGLPSRELTYPDPPKKAYFEDDFPFPKVGYVSSWRVCNY